MNKAFDLVEQIVVLRVACDPDLRAQSPGIMKAAEQLTVGAAMIIHLVEGEGRYV